MSEAACEALLREADKDRYLASLFAPADKRRHLHALYAFDVEIARVASRVREPMAGEIRLQWWRDVIAGERREEASANPVAAALVATLDETGIARATLDTLLDARARDLYHDPMLSRAELDAYAFETNGAVLRLAAAMLTGEQEAAFADAAKHAGEAATLVSALRNLPVHASHRQTILPDDLLQEHHVDREDIFAGRVTPPLTAALAGMRGWARTELDKFRAAERALAPEAKPAFLHIHLLPAVLGQMEKRGYDPFRTAIEVPQWRRQWRLWRAAR